MEITQAVKERGIGVGMIALGLALSYAFIYSPYTSILAADQEVSIGYKSALLGPLALIIGLFYLLLGERAAVLFGRTAAPTWKTYTLVVVFMLVSSLPYFWLHSQFVAHGYS